jgi:NADH dehydrogenase
VLPELGPELGAYADRVLSGRGIEIHPKSKVTAVTPREVVLTDGTRLESFALVWTAGTSPNPIVDRIALPKERGKIKVSTTLAVENTDGVWAVGDCALIPDLTKPGSFHPPTAQHASREGVVLARNILAVVQGRAQQNFSFKTLGLLASIGRRVGVARVFGINFSGFTAWWMWRTIYLSKLPRLEKKISVALAWTLDLFFAKDFVQYLDFDGQPAGSVRPTPEYIPLREECVVPPVPAAPTTTGNTAPVAVSVTSGESPELHRP